MAGIPKPKPDVLRILEATNGQMLSRRALHGYGVTDAVLDAHDDRGEIAILGDGPLGSIIITDVGLATIAEST